MKDDAPAPQEIPSKRRQLHHAPDHWLAIWASRDDLTNAERRRVDGERDRRKRMRKQSNVIVGVCVGREGITPEQFDYIAGYVTGMGPLAIVHAGMSDKLARVFEVYRLNRVGDFPEVVRQADVIVAAVKEPTEPVHKSGVWGAVKYARHRRTMVRIVLPNGMEG